MNLVKSEHISPSKNNNVMRKVLSLLLIFFSIQVYAQEQTKGRRPLESTVYAHYSFVVGTEIWDGSLTGNGISIGYSRYFKKRIYGDVTIGKIDYDAKGSKFLFSKAENDRFNMTLFTLGVGYDLVQNSDFILSAETGYMRNSLTHKSSFTGTPPNQAFSTVRSSFGTIRVGLKGRFYVTDNLQVVPFVSHDLLAKSFVDSSFNLAIAYSF